MRPVTCSNGLFIRTCGIAVKQKWARLGSSTRLKEGNVVMRGRCKKFAHLRLVTPHVSLKTQFMGVCRIASQVGCNWAPFKGCWYEFSPHLPIFIETPNLQLSLQPPLPTPQDRCAKALSHIPRAGRTDPCRPPLIRSLHSRIGKWCISTGPVLQTCSKPQVGLRADSWPGRLCSTECNGVLPMSNWWLSFCMAGGRERKCSRMYSSARLRPPLGPQGLVSRMSSAL
jgi:hypothetical protein